VLEGALEPQVHGRESALRHKHRDGVHVLLNASAQFDGDNRLLSVTAFVTDITARKRAELELKQQATHDALTGLPNRIFLEEKLPSILNFAARGQVNAVLLVDLDGFKQINDTLGHAAGDALLCEVARRLRRHTREGDIVARLGGDEFVLVAHCADGTRSAEGMAAQLIGSLREPIDVGQQQVLVGASIGISLSPQDGITRDELFAHADAAMYRAKAAGRNRFCFYGAGADRPAAAPEG
jgi:diguanylate cyclase (GGDEF)-like protein